jgi:hypothetical protein
LLYYIISIKRKRGCQAAKGITPKDTSPYEKQLAILFGNLIDKSKFSHTISGQAMTRCKDIKVFCANQMIKKEKREI